MPIDPQLAAMLEFIASAGYPPMHQQTPDEARKGFRVMAVDMVKPEDVVAVGQVEETTLAGRPARVFRPEGTARGTLLYLHGGGFVIGDLDTHDQVCRRFCAGADVVVVSLDYRLAPEHPFPAGLDDARAALLEVASGVDDLGGRPLAVGGDSAGGNLSAVLAQEHSDLLDAQLLIYPATDPSGDFASRTENGTGFMLDLPTMMWFHGQYAGAADVELTDPRLAPLRGELAGAPPALVVTAELDPLRDEGEAYAGRLAEAGVHVDAVRYDGLIHGFIDFGTFSAAAADATADVVARFRSLMA